MNATLSLCHQAVTDALADAVSYRSGGGGQATGIGVFSAHFAVDAL